MNQFPLELHLRVLAAASPRTAGRMLMAIPMIARAIWCELGGVQLSVAHHYAYILCLSAMPYVCRICDGKCCRARECMLIVHRLRLRLVYSEPFSRKFTFDCPYPTNLPDGSEILDHMLSDTPIRFYTPALIAYIHALAD